MPQDIIRPYEIYSNIIVIIEVGVNEESDFYFNNGIAAIDNYIKGNENITNFMKNRK